MQGELRKISDVGGKIPTNLLASTVCYLRPRLGWVYYGQSISVHLLRRASYCRSLLLHDRLT